MILQYLWATGTFNPDNPTKDAVTSAAVMERAHSEIAFLGGQNMFDVFIEANEMARGDALTMHDEDINSIWRDAVRAYAAGTKTRDETIEFFRTEAYQSLGIPSR